MKPSPTNLSIKSGAIGCLSVALFLVISFCTGCSYMKQKQPEPVADSLLLMQEQQYLIAKLEHDQRILVLRINERFEVKDTLFSYLRHEEIGMRRIGRIKIDAVKRICYFFDPVYAEYPEIYLSNSLLSLNLNDGTITQIQDFKDFNIAEWEFDFERNLLFFTDYEKHILYRFNLDTKTHEAIWHFEDEAPLWHLDMEFNQESIILFYKNDFNTRETIISHNDNKILSNRIIWTTPHPYSNNIFKRNNDEFIEITRTELGSDRMTLFIYNTEGGSISRELQYRLKNRVDIEWLNQHIVVRHDEYMSVYNRDLELVSFNETGKLFPVSFVIDLGIIYRASSSWSYFLLKPDHTMTELRGDLFRNVEFIIQDITPEEHQMNTEHRTPK